MWEIMTNWNTGKPSTCLQMCHPLYIANTVPQGTCKADEINEDLPVFSWELDAGTLKDFIFLFFEIFHFFCQSLDRRLLL